MTGRAEFWRGLLVLGRVSNLPTVWSNCLAGWLLGGGGPGWSLAVLGFGASLLYVGGMYLNDAIDVEFDRQHRRERPIPSGTVSESMVWLLGISFLLAGAFTLAVLGATVAVFSILLLVNIVVYDVVHKWMAIAPLIMAGCRVWLFLAAASTGSMGVSGYSVWCSLALGGYVVGLSCLARRESLASPASWWPLIFLCLPLCLALLINNGSQRLCGLLLVAILIGWVIFCLRHVVGSTDRHIGRTVSGLLAGISLVDLLAVGADVTMLPGLAFGVLLVCALVLQRWVPAT